MGRGHAPLHHTLRDFCVPVSLNCYHSNCGVAAAGAAKPGSRCDLPLKLSADICNA